MKNLAQRRACPRLRHCKSKGEWAELAFLAKAVGLGFTVCQPYGENHRFDFLLYARGGKVTRIQVKSSWVINQKKYRFKTTGASRYHYRRGEVDFFAVLVAPEDTWYIIPRNQAAPYDVGYLAPHHPSNGRLEKFREAWHLLRGRSRRSRRP